MFEFEECNDLATLAGKRDLWNSLLQRTPQATFHHTLDRLEVYCKHYAEKQRLRVITVYRDGEAIGILPLEIRRRANRLKSYGVLAYPLRDWVAFYGPIGPQPRITLAEGLRYACQSRRDWDVIDLQWTDFGGEEVGETWWALRQAGLGAHEHHCCQAPLTDMQGTWEQYWHGRDKKWRHNVERLVRRMARSGKVAYVRYRPRGAAYGDDDPRWDLYDACSSVAARSWQSDSVSGTTLSHASVCRYLRELHAVAVRTGAADLNLLLLDNRPIAFAYNFQYQGRVWGSKMGYDSQAATLGPGTVLMDMMLEDCFQRGDLYFDVGPGTLKAKEPWQTRLVTGHRYVHYSAPVSWRQVVRATQRIGRRISGLLHPFTFGNRVMPCAR